MTLNKFTIRNGELKQDNDNCNWAYPSPYTTEQIQALPNFADYKNTDRFYGNCKFQSINISSGSYRGGQFDKSADWVVIET